MYFSSDWLNEYWDSLDVDDYRFVYMGPTGTWYSLSASSLLLAPHPLRFPACGPEAHPLHESPSFLPA